MSKSKNDDLEVTVILAKTSWCPHCIDFTPIYQKAGAEINKIAKSNKINKQFTFHSFEIDKENEKKDFEQKFGELTDFINGFPSVLIKYKGGGKNYIVPINHTFIKKTDKKPNDGELKELEKIAVEEFVNNIFTNVSDKKDVFVNPQNGGNIYKEKYLKYKAKYIELKKNNLEL